MTFKEAHHAQTEVGQFRCFGCARLVLRAWYHRTYRMLICRLCWIKVDDVDPERTHA